MSLSEDQNAALAKKRGQAAAAISDPDERQKFIKAQGDLNTAYQKGDYKNKQGSYEDSNRKLESEADDKNPAGAGNKVIPQYKGGTDHVKKTGPAVLHKGEAVLKKADADKYRAAKQSVFGGLSELSGDGEPQKSKKEIDHIRTRKAKSGGYIHEHHHTHPEDHPMEQHVSSDQNAMLSHMAENMGDQADPAAAPGGEPAAA